MRKVRKNRKYKRVKSTILEVFDRIGGVQNFAEWALKNQTEFYRHYAKLLPAELAIKQTVTIDVVAELQGLRQVRDKIDGVQRTYIDSVRSDLLGYDGDEGDDDYNDD